MKALLYTTINIFVNLFLVIIKLVFGVIFNSAAIVSDGIHSFSDFLTDIITYFGIKKSYQPADDEHPLGHGKYEYVASLITGMLIFFMSYELLRSLIFEREISKPNILGSYVIVITIILKIIMATILIKKGKEYDNHSLTANGYEGLSDVFSSLVALIGVLLAQLQYNWVMYADVAASIIIILFIVRTGFKITASSIHLLLGTNIDKKNQKEYRDIVYNAAEEIKNVDKMIVLKYGPYHQIIVDIQVAGTMAVDKAHDIARIAKRELLALEKVSYVKIHIEPFDENENINNTGYFKKIKK